jgi:MFS family permease
LLSTALPATATNMSRKPLYGNLIGAIATVGACDIAFGLSLQLIPLIQHEKGTPASLIGAAAAMGPLGILLAGPLLPSMIKWAGAKPVAYAAIATILISLFGFAATSFLPIWFPLRFAMGVAAGALFTVSETWILNFATDQNRGRIMGIYTSVLSVTFAVGPLILPFTGIHGWLPWIIGMICVALGALPLTFVNVTSAIGEKSHSFFGVFRRAPILFIAIATATFFDSVFISFFTIFALAKNVPLATASSMLGFGVIGCTLMFYPMGWLGDHWSRDKVVMCNAGITIVTGFLLVGFINTWAAWPLVLIFCGTAFGVYVVSLAMMGDVFKGADVVSGSAAIAAMWGVGGLAGPPIAGAAIDAFGVNAMPYTLIAIYIVLLIFLIANGGKIVRPENQGSQS